LQGVAQKEGIGQRPGRRLVVSFAIALALVSLFFLLGVVPHGHEKGQDDPACRLCQVAHMGVAPIVSVTLLNLVLLYFGEILVPVCLISTDSFFEQSPSRAPPALFA
jgi:hypothetical protein